jgi:aspartate/methionine/tyrosine aminotransferase
MHARTKSDAMTTTFRPFLLERWFARYEHAVGHPLSASDCEPLLVSELLATCGLDPAVLLDLRLQYGHSSGDPELRAAIAAHYPECAAEDVLVAGAPQEAITVAMQALLSPGDRVVVQTPCYQSLHDVPVQLGCEVLAWPLRVEGHTFGLDWVALEDRLRAAPRMIVTNFPHNPTGVQPTPAQWLRLAGLIDQSGALWFSDEMYRGLAVTDAAELTPAASLAPRALSLWGLSKSFGMPGLRLGWLVGRDREHLRAIEERKDYTSICSNTVAEFAATHALRHTRALLETNRGRIAANKERMAAFARRHAQLLAWAPPQAGPVSLARVHDGTATAMAEAVRAQDAMLVPSSLFDLDDQWLRVGLGRADFATALACWDRALGG